MRIVAVTGGGGAGVTTFAAASAVYSAARGRRTRLLAADPAPLETLLGPDGERPPALTVANPDPASLLGAGAEDALAWLRALLRWAGLDAALAGDITQLPGATGLAALLEAAAGVEEHDLTVVDLGPAPQSLSLIALVATRPEAADGQRGGNRSVVRALAPLLAQLVDLPRPDRTVRAAGERVAAQTERLRGLVVDSSAFSVRLMLPGDARAAYLEREARTVGGLYGVSIDATVRRSGVPATGPLPAADLNLPFSESPPAGTEALRALGETAYGERPPAALLQPSQSPRCELTEGGANLLVPIPPRPASEFSLRRRGEALDLRAGTWRRTLPLPAELRDLRARAAWHDGTVFRVQFTR